MRALRYYGRRDIRFETLVVPDPKEGEVRLKVTDVGLCQTQINEFVEGPFIINKDVHPLTRKSIPLTPGHEYGGIVDAVGDGVSPELIGKKVSVLPRISCGECEYCLEKNEHLCTELAYYGLLGEDGGLADYSVVNVKNIFISHNDETLTYIEPIAVSLHAYERFKSCITDRPILILGAGAIGVSLAALLRDYANLDIVISDPMPNRLARAKTAGFKTLNSQEIQATSYDIVCDCAGSDPYTKESALVEAFTYARKGGTVVGIGAYFHPVSFMPIAWTISEQDLINSFSYNSSDEENLSKVLESLNVDFSIFNEYISLDRIIEDGYLRAEVDKDSFTRLVVRC